MKDKLTSRKFWIAILMIAVLVLQKQYELAVTTALGYMGINVAQKFSNNSNSQLTANDSSTYIPGTDDEPDTTKIIPGE